MSLPDADEVYTRFFDPWYDEEDRKQKGFACTRPDMLDGYRKGLTAADLCRLSDRSRDGVLRQVQTMVTTAKSDWTGYLAVTGEVSESWVRAFDEYYNEEEVGKVIERSDPADFSSDLVVLVCQFGAVLGEVLRQRLPRLEWVAEWPYWESSLYDPATGSVIPTFHWSIKKFSDYGVDDGFVGKLALCVGILDGEGESKCK